jgi:WD repeat and SOF domain-containing protein 1
MDDWKYIYVEQGSGEPTALIPRGIDASEPQVSENKDTDYGFTKRRGVEWEVPPISLPPTQPYASSSQRKTPCDPRYPRIFHMFWTGPFTDKPYLALLSFLYTQNVGLHVKEYPVDTAACRPQFWLWINPGPAASIPNPNAVRDMFGQLKANPWAAPFLHPRFKDVIQFKLWNTTEQLDGVPEIKDHWRYVFLNLKN